MLSQWVRNEDRDILLRHILSYLAVVLLTAGIGAVTYVRSYVAIREQAVASIRLGIGETVARIETRLQEVDNAAAQFFVSARESFRALRLVEPPLAASDHYTLLRIQQEMPRYHVVHTLIQDIYVIVADRNLIITPQYIATDIERFYDGFLSFSDLPFDEWLVRLHGRPRSRYYAPPRLVRDPSNSWPAVPVYYDVPDIFPGSRSTVLMILIRVDQLHELVISDQREFVSWYALVADNGELIVASDGIGRDTVHQIDKAARTSGTRGVLERGDDVILTADLSGVQWRFFASVSQASIHSGISYIRDIYLIAVVTLVLLGLGLAVFLSFRNSKPLRSMNRLLREQARTEGSAIRTNALSVEKRVASIFAQNRTLRDQLGAQTPVLRELLIERILRGHVGGLVSDAEAERLLGLRLASGDGVLVFVIHVGHMLPTTISGSETPIQAVRLVVRHIAEQIMVGVCHFHDLGSNEIAGMCRIAVENRGQGSWKRLLTDQLHQVVRRCSEDLALATFVGVGDIQDRLADTSLSYSRARRASHSFLPGQQGTVIWYHDLESTVGGYEYPLEIQQRFTASLLAGDARNGIDYLDQVLQNNLYENPRPFEDQALLLADIRGTLYRAINEALGSSPSERTDFVERISQMDLSAGLETVHAALKTVLRDLCATVESQKKSHNTALRDRIIDYVSDNYAEYDLGLTLIASRFGISEGYLSDFFREQTGEKLSGYIERIRLSSAERLLKGDRIHVAEIGRACGYRNPNTFYKAFRRQFGMGPSEYRAMVVSQET